MSDDIQVVDITIRNNLYKVACNENEKKHLLELAKRFEILVSSLSNSAKGKGSDALMFLLAGLTLEDKIEELKTELEKTTKEMLKYKPYFEDHLQVNHILNEIVSYSISRIEQLIQLLENPVQKKLSNIDT